MKGSDFLSGWELEASVIYCGKTVFLFKLLWCSHCLLFILWYSQCIWIFLAGYWCLTWKGHVAVVGENWVLVENSAVYLCCMKFAVFGKFWKLCFLYTWLQNVHFMYALWYSFKLRTVIVMQVKNCFFLDCFGKCDCCFAWVPLNSLCDWEHWCQTVTVYTVFQFIAVDVDRASLFSHITFAWMSVFNATLMFLISSSCFRSPKLVCSNWKPLSRCVAHFQTNLLKMAFFFYLIICPLFFWMQKSWDVTPLTIGWWTDVSWILYHLCVWLVTLHV